MYMRLFIFDNSLNKPVCNASGGVVVSVSSVRAFVVVIVVSVCPLYFWTQRDLIVDSYLQK